MAGYFESRNAQQIAHEAARRSLNGRAGPLAGTLEFSRPRANLWITATADSEGVALNDTCVVRARSWLNMTTAVEGSP